MASRNKVTATEAIQNQIKTLCLREFPCGTGSWSKKEPQLETITDKREDLSEPETDDTQKEKSDDLQELIVSPYSPWYMDYSWSMEARGLRETAVKTPWVITTDFLYSYFKTLKITDKAVTDIDDQLVKFKNLEELTLSANFISKVNSRYLPRKLKVLELCSNNISDISDLCVMPPPLLHLGLGRNRIFYLEDYISGTYWPSLLSLDLSHNDLCDLRETLTRIGTLPKLKNLILLGNPLSLVPGYRGYIIDFLHNLSTLDDVHISADEEYNFKGISKLRELRLDRAKVQLGVTYVKGLCNPDKANNQKRQSLSPFVEKSYFVQFMFPEEQNNKTKTTEKEADDNLIDLKAEDGAAISKQQQENEPENGQKPVFSSECQEQAQTEIANLCGTLLFGESTSIDSKSVLSKPNLGSSEGKRGGTEFAETNLGFVLEGQPLEDIDEKRREAEDISELRLAPLNSEAYPWQEEMTFNWAADINRSNLLTVRNFFRMGMDVSIVEQTILGYHAAPDVSQEKTGDSKIKERKKSKVEPDKIKEKGRGKKEVVMELVKCPPTYTNIVTFHMSLDNLLNGEFEQQKIFTTGSAQSLTNSHSKTLADGAFDKLRDKKDKLIKSPEDKTKDSKKSPRDREPEKKSSKDVEEPADSYYHNLEMEVTVKLHHWLTLLDLYKEDMKLNL